MHFTENMRILGLSPKEAKILKVVIESDSTVLLVAKKTGISRPTVYEILRNLHKRGLVHTRIISGKKYWTLQKVEVIDSALYEAKKALLSISEGVEEAKGMSDGTILVHRGRDAVKRLVETMLKGHKREWLYVMQGDAVQKGWEDHVGKKTINEFNQYVTKNEILTSAVIPKDWFSAQLARLSPTEAREWLSGFARRAFKAVTIENEYFSHAGQIFIFKDSLYLMSMNEALVVEIRNSEIQKIILELFRYAQENARTLNVNEEVARLLGKLEEVI